MEERVVAIILAAGTGIRMKMTTPKQFLRIAGKPVVIHTLLQFDRSNLISDIVVVCSKNHIKKMHILVNKNKIKKVYRIIPGGKTRQESSFNGLKNCPPHTKFVLIHDAVRPFVNDKIIADTLRAAKKIGASDTVINTEDTIIVKRGSFIETIPDRKRLKRGQTPQGFCYEAIIAAHKFAQKNRIVNSPDDCKLILSMGKPVSIVNGSIFNIKLTNQSDLYLAERLFQLKRERVIVFDYSSLYKKVAVIAGGKGGIGSEVVALLKKYGCIAIPISRSSEIKCDVRNEESVKKCFSKILKVYKKINILVNSTGILKMSKVEDMNINDWNEIFSVNFTGAFFLSKHILPILKKEGEGHIVHVASSSYTKGRMNYSAYSASKAALVNFCQSLADEVREDNIYVNVISPQRVATEMRVKNFGREENLLSPQEVAKEIVRYCVIKKTGHIVDIRAQK